MIITRGYGEGANIITKGYGFFWFLRPFARAVKKVEAVLLEPKISMIPLEEPVFMGSRKTLLRPKDPELTLIGSKNE